MGESGERRYAERWERIPPGELHASSVQHPVNPEWRWLLHTRCVTVSAAAPVSDGGAAQPAASRPPCAGVGADDAVTYCCQDCRGDLCGARPRMPKFALANDLWIGRLHPFMQNASLASRWLQCLGRPVWRKVILRGDPATTPHAFTGNTILLAQPSAGTAIEELPPPIDALVDTVTIAFAKSAAHLERATYLTVDRRNYLACARLRQKVCPTFQHVRISEPLADTRLPALGVPDHIRECLVEIEGSDEATFRVPGPANVRDPTATAAAPGDASSESEREEDDGADAAQPGDITENVAAIDEFHSEEPVRRLQTLHALWSQAEAEARQVSKNERQGRVAGGGEQDAAIMVEDAGGREACRRIILDISSVARHLTERQRAQIEVAAAGAESVRPVSTACLAVPTGQPLSMFDARSWTASFTEFWYGDGVPFLQRDRHLTFEDWAAAMLEREELQYDCALDAVGLPLETIGGAAPLTDGDAIEEQACGTGYVAQRVCRFVSEDILACIGSANRRLQELLGTRTFRLCRILTIR